MGRNDVARTLFFWVLVTICTLAVASTAAAQTSDPADRFTFVPANFPGAPTLDIVIQRWSSDADRERVDLIVMSSHGRTGLSRMLIGSVTDKVLRGAPCPLLVVPPETFKD